MTASTTTLKLEHELNHPGVVNNRKDAEMIKGGEIRDTKTLNLSPNIVSFQVLVDVSRFRSP